MIYEFDNIIFYTKTKLKYEKLIQDHEHKVEFYDNQLKLLKNMKELSYFHEETRSSMEKLVKISDELAEKYYISAVKVDEIEDTLDFSNIALRWLENYERIKEDISEHHFFK